MPECRSCQAEIVWMKTESGKNIPVNPVPSTPDRFSPKYTEDVFDPERHESHFATCPNADRHRKPR